MQLSQLAARLPARLFPGSRAVWAGALAVCLVGGVLLLRFMTSDVATLTGTNSVAPVAVIAKAGDGEEVCVRDLVVPRGTRRVGVWMGPLEPSPQARVDARLETPDGRMRLSREGPPRSADFTPFSLPRTLEQDLVEATVCVVPRGLALDLGGASVQRLPEAPTTTVAGQPLVGTDVAVHFLRPAGESDSLLGALRTALRRAGVFEPGLGKLLLWLALPALALLVYLVVRVTATAGSRSVRQLAALAALVTFVHAGAWAVLMHPFQGADESEHFAYAQHVAATDDRPDSARDSTRPPYSSSQLRLMEALHHNSTILHTSSRPRWEERWQDEYRAAARGTADDADGGGFSESASGHSPLYYFVVGLPYRLFGDAGDLPPVLLAMRLLNAALASLVGALAVLTAAMLFGARHRPLAWLAGVLAGLQPVFGSVAAVINNDTGVNVAGAGLVFLLVRAWSRGPTLGNAALAGVVAIALPLAKVTGFALLPVLAVALVAVAARHGLRGGVRWGGAVIVSALATAALWVFAISPLIGAGQGEIHNVHPAIAPAAGAPPPPESPLTNEVRLEYFLQTFLPWPTVGRDHWDLEASGPLGRWPAYAIYIDRGYGLFGWQTVYVSRNLRRAIFVGLAIGWMLAVVAVLRRRRAWRRWLAPVAILATALLGVLALVSYAYATPDLRRAVAEQGRYVFPALAPLAVMLSAYPLAFRGRLRRLALGVGASGAGLVALAAWLHALRGWFL